MKARHLIVPILLLIMTTSAQGEPSAWTLDTAHSGVYFDARHIFATVRGHFESYEALINIDPEEMTHSSCEFTVQAKSITTFNRKRDTHLRSAELLDTGKYPTLTFKSTQISARGDNLYTIEGNLTMHGVTRKISAPFVFHGIKPNPFKASQMVAGFTTQFTINRLDFHVGDGKFYTMGVMDKAVDITLSIEALK